MGRPRKYRFGMNIWFKSQFHQTEALNYGLSLRIAHDFTELLLTTHFNGLNYLTALESALIYLWLWLEFLWVYQTKQATRHIFEDDTGRGKKNCEANTQFICRNLCARQFYDRMYHISFVNWKHLISRYCVVAICCFFTDCKQFSRQKYGVAVMKFHYVFFFNISFCLYASKIWRQIYKFIVFDLKLFSK